MPIIREEGKTLVICCEGNAGFYEIGMMGTPVAGNRLNRITNSENKLRTMRTPIESWVQSR